MAVKASVTITISKYRDTNSITRYYKLQASTAAAPVVPTTLTPSGWSTSEPTYTSGSTNTLYYTDCIVFSDGAFQYTDDGNGKAVKSSSYEAAKQAYNKAQAAQNTANTTQENLDNLEIGGRNYLLNSSKYREDKPWTINNTTENDSIVIDHTLRIYFEQDQEYIIQVKSDGDVANSHGYKTDNIGKFTLWFYERFINSEKDESKCDYPRCFHKLVNNNTQKYLGNKGNTYYWYYKCPSNIRDACIRMNTYADTENPVTIHFWDLKIERGNKPTDWTPAPEDIDNAIAKTVKQVDVEYYLSTSSTSVTGGSWSTTAPAWVDGKYMWSRQKVTYVDNTTATRNETCIAGAKGATGSPGGTGATGTGVESITEEYYLSTSKSSQTGGSWVTTPPTWSTGKYIWTRSKIVYKNPSSTVYTTPVCSSEWEAINDVSIGGRNLLLGTGTASGDVSNGNGSKIENLDLYNGISGVKTNIWWSERFMNLKAVALRGGFNIGDNLVASVYIKSDSNITCNVSFHRSTGTGNIGGSTKTYNSVTITPEWKQYWFPFVADEGSLNRTDTRIEIDKSTGDNYVYWAGWKLEKGNKATDWTPAPEDMNDAIKSVINLYYSSNSSTLPAKPTTHVTTNNTTTRNAWNIGLPTYDEQYPYLYTCKEVLNKGGTYSWTTVNQTTYSEAIKTIQTELDAVQADYLKESTFSTYKREQIKTDQKIEHRLSTTEVTVYGDPENPDDPKALINHIQKVDNDINGSGGLDDRLGAAEGTIEGTGLNEYDQRIKITQRFLNVETDVESIKNIFNITGGTNLIQNSVGYFASNNKPSMWDIASNTIYTPFGYDGDLTGVTVSRGKLFCAKGSITTTTNNIIALLSNKMVSISFKYKNGANATSKIKIFNGSIIYFEKTFNTTVNQWTEYRFDPDTDPILANPTFLNTSNSLQISIESTNSTDNNGFEISDLMLNYGNVKPWELYSNEVYGAMVKLSSLGIEVTATTANTKNFIATDGILVYRYDSKTDKIIGTEPITKITDNGTITNKLESTGDIIERNLIQTVIKDSSNKDIYVEYIR